MKNIQFKNNNGGVTDVDVNKRIVTGYLSKTNVMDLDRDIIEPQAFTKTLAERRDDIFFLNQHNWNQPHGKFKTLEIDAYGLKFESNPLPDTSYSNDTIKLYDAGIIKEHSIGFYTIQSDYNNETDVRVIKELKLYEGSNVTLGANPGAVFTGLKGLTLADVSEREKEILKAFRTGSFTDETFTLLEIALKQLQLYTFELGKQAATPPTPDPSTIEAVKGQEFINLLKTIKF